MKCPKCGTEMKIYTSDDGRIAVCPDCKTQGKLAAKPDAAPKKKKGGCLKIIAIAIGVLLLIGIIGALFTGNNNINEMKFKTADVVNGTGDTVIGQYGYIEITEKAMKEITQEDLDTFVEKHVDGSGLNYVTIACENEKGIVFTGSDKNIFVYGTLGEDKILSETIKTYILKDGKYIEINNSKE